MSDSNQVADNFESARALFVDGVQDFEAGRCAAADEKFAASLALLPGRVSTMNNLAATRIKLGRTSEALALLDQALAAEPENIDAWSHRGVALSNLERHEEALACFSHVLQAEPARTLALFHRGIALNALRRHDDALLAFDEFLRSQPQHADAWFRHGQTLQSLDRHDDALASYDKALAHEPGMAPAWIHRGSILKDQNRLDEATVAFEQAIAHGGDPELNGYFLAAVAGRPAPNTAPRQYVQGLFDDYAAGFEAHLVGMLKYQAHTVLVENLCALGERRFSCALDLGCGTGLCGPLIRPLAERLDGIDLSSNMLEQARALATYDALIESDIAEYLRATDQRYDLVVAADVFIYVGDLEPVFAGVRRVMEPGGVFCFSAELPERGEDLELKPTLRYGQSERYVRELAMRHGFEIMKLVHQPIREDRQQPVAGYYAYLSRT